jgi:dihydroneopterin aldolase
MNEIPEGTGDLIHIQELEIEAHVGVPEKERAAAQRLTLSITLWPAAGFDQLQDELTYTVDYADVCREVKQFVSDRSDKLIETLGEGIAAHLLRSFAVQRVRVELRKFILPDVKYVSVALVREHSSVM